MATVMASVVPAAAHATAIARADDLAHPGPIGIDGAKAPHVRGFIQFFVKD